MATQTRKQPDCLYPGRPNTHTDSHVYWHVWILEVTAVGASAALIGSVIPLLKRIAKSVDMLRADLGEDIEALHDNRLRDQRHGQSCERTTRTNERPSQTHGRIDGILVIGASRVPRRKAAPGAPGHVAVAVVSIVVPFRNGRSRFLVVVHVRTVAHPN